MKLEQLRPMIFRDRADICEEMSAMLLGHDRCLLLRVSALGAQLTSAAETRHMSAAETRQEVAVQERHM